MLRAVKNGNRPGQQKSGGPTTAAFTGSKRTAQPENGLMRLQRGCGNQGMLKFVSGAVLQRKLTTNQPSDVFGQKADRVADTVTRTPDTPVNPQPIIQIGPAHTESLKTPACGPPKKACVKEAVFPKDNFRVINRDQVGEQFRMHILWDNAAENCACCCGEYRQFVRGHIRVNGKDMADKQRGKKKLLSAGARLDDNHYHEDGDGRGHRYGHRGEIGTKVDQFLQDRSSGCLYKGHDFPGITLEFRPADVVDILLQFKGQTFDVCNNVFGNPKEWRVEIRQTIP
jgi:hypothetical protein